LFRPLFEVGGNLSGRDRLSHEETVGNRAVNSLRSVDRFLLVFRYKSVTVVQHFANLDHWKVVRGDEQIVRRRVRSKLTNDLAVLIADASIPKKGVKVLAASPPQRQSASRK
jgi:hypothetical protein